ncbi:Crp/Fnr family transcriptional regulator [Enterovirga rhinocerotis]|uniref:CRP-like cAMP-binding protein n=1 Tax=Enterovirga rhinocerotis TaxID=1339210 RepID=A0A4R7BX58_9HYPH|nr:Crp/Fnr family transcriptional regulator [Enterovirga rhinocerotis]TDR90093.1 CRP-like cAMP-binding protein [Enterovirga rhinocerotis]
MGIRVLLGRESRNVPLLRRVETVAALSAEEREALLRVPMSVRDLPPRTDILCEGERPETCCVVLSGYAIRYKIGAEGDRHIIAFHVPGDIPDLQSLHLAVMDHTLASLTGMTAGLIAHRDLHDLNLRYPRLAGALWRLTLVDAAVFREWIVNLGHRDALSRTAHFLCEMHTRLASVGLGNGDAIELPISQTDLADALGVSAVHMNRTLQELRARKLIESNGRMIMARDWSALAALGEFDPAYLHITPHERADPA